ncbi:GeoRSP system PqqD family peptide chaperone [Geobacter sp. DSM 9736]|uniref:GeoRSP system PqqD family peptide chaperone n=1 Tax=Geobacter sp. DSM 9736 TaxID=1277350 RepID=UPI000B510605|nr:GeoRSP system PqqD family peptide chaperone [Geobacter sp. DSM 9736]SNB47467.1 GeoRSP system PqqD family protein [Geobacter sp. DSM 9736]
MATIYRNPDVMWREEDDARDRAADGLERGEDIEDIGTSLLFANGVMVTLNMLGTEIWKTCEGKTSEEIVLELLREFDVEEDVLREDVRQFLEGLAAQGFITYGK